MIECWDCEDTIYSDEPYWKDVPFSSLEDICTSCYKSKGYGGGYYYDPDIENQRQEEVPAPAPTPPPPAPPVAKKVDYWRMNSVPETPTGTAPCGCPGVHVLNNFVRCLNGCP